MTPFPRSGALSRLRFFSVQANQRWINIEFTLPVTTVEPPFYTIFIY